MQRVSQRRTDARSARVANRNWALGHFQRRLQHVAEFVLVLRGHDGHVGQATEVGQIENAMVGAPVVSSKSRTVDGERHWEALQTDVMNNLIIGALEKRRIDADDRTHALGGETRGEGDRMLLGNADVEEAIWIDR